MPNADKKPEHPPHPEHPDHPQHPDHPEHPGPVPPPITPGRPHGALVLPIAWLEPFGR